MIGALSASYVNASNLGLPVAAYVLGDAALVAPTLLLQLLVLQPLALAVLDADVRGTRPSVSEVLLRPFTNPLTIGTLVGLLLSITGWRLPPLVARVVDAFLLEPVAHHALGLSGHALLAVVVCASLPTAQNIFVHATRYDRSSTLARDTILVTTTGAVPVIMLVVWLLG